VRRGEIPSAFCDFSRLCRKENFALPLSSCATSHDSPSPAVWDPAERIDIAPDPNVRDEPPLPALAPHGDAPGERGGSHRSWCFLMAWPRRIPMRIRLMKQGSTYCVFQKENPQKNTLRREEPRTFAVTRQSTRLVSGLGPIPGQPLECICHCNPENRDSAPDEVDFRSDVPTVMAMSPRAYFLVRIQDGGSDTEIIPMIPSLAHAIASALRAGGGGGRRRQCRRCRDQHNYLTHILTPVLERLQRQTAARS
jgi:hypothetical protein